VVTLVGSWDTKRKSNSERVLRKLGPGDHFLPCRVIDRFLRGPEQHGEIGLVGVILYFIFIFIFTGFYLLLVRDFFFHGVLGSRIHLFFPLRIAAQRPLPSLSLFPLWRFLSLFDGFLSRRARGLCLVVLVGPL
jgi:hypothetical protein